MLIRLNSQLRTHRRRVLIALAVLASGVALAAAHGAVMSAEMPGHLGEVAAVCLFGGLTAVTAGGLAISSPHPRLRWRMAAPLAPVIARVSATPGRAARAGPPPPLLQVFRL